jgi:hypothetical protein
VVVAKAQMELLVELGVLLTGAVVDLVVMHLDQMEPLMGLVLVVAV